MKLSHDELKGLMKNKLMKAGLNEDHADIAAEVMTWSDERGYHSHGAVRVEYYAERIAKGGITADPKFEWEETGPCSGGFLRAIMAADMLLPSTAWIKPLRWQRRTGSLLWV